MIKSVLLKIIDIWKSIPADRIYLVLLAICGCVCLTVTGGWHYYTDPVKDGGAMLMAQLGIELPEKEEEPEKLVADAGDDESETKSSDAEKDKEEDNEGSKESEVEDPMLASRETVDYRVESAPESDTESEPELEPEPEPEPAGPVFQTVEDDYFNDAVFIGDSRTVGMYEYSSLKETSTFYASVGLSVHKLFKSKIVEVPGKNGKITVDQALSENQFSKVYFMLGINEMGTGTPESFMEKYQECVNRIRELQPNAIIYLQGIMQVTETRSAKGDAITNEGIALRNEGIKAMADDETIFYLEVNEAVCDESGALNADYTHDGVHLKAQYIDLWKDYLKNHAVVRE